MVGSSRSGGHEEGRIECGIARHQWSRVERVATEVVIRLRICWYVLCGRVVIRGRAAVVESKVTVNVCDRELELIDITAGA